MNGGLLFVVLFYVYPLKFMFGSMFAQMVAPLSPVSCALMGPAHWAFGQITERRRRALLAGSPQVAGVQGP